jgi:hypothetical protein
MIRQPLGTNTARRCDFFPLNAAGKPCKLPALILTPSAHGPKLFPPLQKTKAGRGNPRLQTAHSANPADSGAFFMPEIPLWRAGRGTRKCGRFPFEPVFHPRSVRRQSAVESGRDGSKPHQTEPSMSHPNHGQNAPKICPLSFQQADRIDRDINLLTEQVKGLAGDIAVLLYDVTGDRHLKAVQAELKAALKHLEAAKTPARALWIEADEAAASAHQGGRDHG